MKNNPMMSKPVPQMRVDPTTLDRWGCECGGVNFVKVQRYFDVPLLMHAMVGGQDTLLIEAFMCLNCHRIYPSVESMVKLPSEKAIKDKEKTNAKV